MAISRDCFFFFYHHSFPREFPVHQRPQSYLGTVTSGVRHSKETGLGQVLLEVVVVFESIFPRKLFPGDKGISFNRYVIPTRVKEKEK